jgi:hypothetical protein
MLSFNERIKIGKIYFDIQTEYKSTHGTIVGEIIKDGKVLKKVTIKPTKEIPLNDQIKKLHSSIVKLLYQKIFKTSKRTVEDITALSNENDEIMFSLRENIIGIIKNSISEKEIVYLSFRVNNVEVEYGKELKEKIIYKNISRKLSQLQLKSIGKVEESIFSISGSVAVALYDTNSCFLLVSKQLSLGKAILLAHKVKEAIKKELLKVSSSLSSFSTKRGKSSKNTLADESFYQVGHFRPEGRRQLS